jgi:hypothetical protein
MSTQKSLSLLDRFEPSHTSLSHPGHFMRLLSPIVRILRRIVDDLWNQFPMCDTITAQFIGHDLSGLVPVRS